MKRRLVLICALAILMAGGALSLITTTAAAQFTCGTRQQQQPADGNEVILCEHNQSGPTETPFPVSVPLSATTGYIVLMDCGDPNNSADQQNQAKWSDVVHVFLPTANSPNFISPKQAQLISKGGPFPTVNTVMTSQHVFIRENPGPGTDDTNDTMYFDAAGDVTYHIFSAANVAPCDPPAQVPESDTLVLLGSGLAGLAGYAALRWRARRAPRSL